MAEGNSPTKTEGMAKTCEKYSNMRSTAIDESSNLEDPTVQYIASDAHVSMLHSACEERNEPENLVQPSTKNDSLIPEVSKSADENDLHVAALFDRNNLMDMSRVSKIIWELRFPQASERRLMLGNPTCELLRSISRLHMQNWAEIRYEIMNLYTEFMKREMGPADQREDQNLTTCEVSDRMRLKIKTSLELTFDVNDEKTRATHLAQTIIEWADWRVTRSHCLKRSGFYRKIMANFLYVVSLGSVYGVYYLALSTYHDFNKFIISVLYNPKDAEKKYDWPELLSLLLADKTIMSEFLRLTESDIEKVLDATCRRRGMLHNSQTSEWLSSLLNESRKVDESFRSVLIKEICESLINTQAGQQTAAFHITNPLILHDMFRNNTSQLFQLLEITDKKGNTALHSNIKNQGLFSLMLTLYRDQNVPRSQLISLLNISNNNKKTPKDLFPELAWLYHQIGLNIYALYHKPKVLIIYRTTERFGAQAEADRICLALKAIQLNPEVRQDLTEPEIHKEIIKAAEKVKSALIVVIMTHGSIGSITDKDGKSMNLSDIEMSMSLTKFPKLLITQCCQIDSETSMKNQQSSNSIDMRTLCTEINNDPGLRPTVSQSVFAPKHPNMCVIMSCVQGQFSTRDFFIKIFSEQLLKLRIDQGIGSVVQYITDEMRQSGSDQIPIIQNTCGRELCLANCFHLWKS